MPLQWHICPFHHLTPYWFYNPPIALVFAIPLEALAFRTCLGTLAHSIFSRHRTLSSFSIFQLPLLNLALPPFVFRTSLQNLNKYSKPHYNRFRASAFKVTKRLYIYKYLIPFVGFMQTHKIHCNLSKGFSELMGKRNASSPAVFLLKINPASCCLVCFVHAPLVDVCW